MSTNANQAPDRRLSIFLCHAFEDKALVHKLYRKLKADGFEPWLDKENLLPGQHWPKETLSALHTCDIVLVCLSDISVCKEGFVQKEITQALEKSAEKPEEAIFIIPVRLDDKVVVPQRLCHLHWADFSTDDGYRRLLSSLKRRADQIGAYVVPPDCFEEDHFETFLRNHGFKHHPFAEWQADNEEEDLAHWFNPKPVFFHDVLGNLGASNQTIKLVSHLIFGPPGGGKTALRRMIEAEILKRSPASAIIRYIDFRRVLRAGPQRPTFSQHMDELLRLGTISLMTMWLNSEDRYERLSPDHKSELAGLIAEYYDTLPDSLKMHYTSTLNPYYPAKVVEIVQKSGKPAIENYNGLSSIPKRENIGPATWRTDHNKTDNDEQVMRLERFWSLARAMGVANIWILVDIVDEYSHARTSQAIFDCIARILLNHKLMEFQEASKQAICFKFFLPRTEELQPLLKAEGFHDNEILVRTFEWDDDHLRVALRKRLNHYSTQRVSSFDDICDPKLKDTQQRILNECNSNPGTLFFMGYEIFVAFQHSSEVHHKIDKDSIEKGISAAKRRYSRSASFWEIVLLTSFCRLRTRMPAAHVICSSHWK
jgi:hypothetical protein